MIRITIFLFLLSILKVADGQLSGEYYGLYKMESITIDFKKHNEFDYYWGGCTGMFTGFGSYQFIDSTLILNFKDDTIKNVHIKIDSFCNDSLYLKIKGNFKERDHVVGGALFFISYKNDDSFFYDSFIKSSKQKFETAIALPTIMDTIKISFVHRFKTKDYLFSVSDLDTQVILNFNQRFNKDDQLRFNIGQIEKDSFQLQRQDYFTEWTWFKRF